MKLSGLRKHPKTFLRLTGLTVEKFDPLLEQLLPIFEKAEKKRLSRPNRQRAMGGGRRYALELGETLVMVLMYYRLYVTHALLGVLFDVSESTVSRRIGQIEPLLAQIFRMPTRRIELAEEELIELFVDATEQEIERPKKGQKAWYSGKKKRHTIKHQVVVDQTGKIRAVSRAHKGKVHDKKIYDRERVRMPPGVSKTGDKGDQGAQGMHTPIKKPPGGTLTKEQKQHNRTLAQRRMVVEHTLRKMKIFRILSYRFRTPRKRHTLIFKNVAGVHNVRFA